MFRFAELLALVGLFVGAMAGLYRHTGGGPTLFTLVVPAGLVLAVLLNWYHLVLRVYRGQVPRRGYPRALLWQLLVMAALVAVPLVHFPSHRAVLRAVYVEGRAEARTAVLEAFARTGGGPPSPGWLAREGLAAWRPVSPGRAPYALGSTPRAAAVTTGLLLLLLAPALLGVLSGRPRFEDWLRARSELFFARHRRFLEGSLTKEERAKRSFSAVEGFALPFSFLWRARTVALLTDRRLVLVREARGLGPPVTVRSIPLQAVRAVRGGDRFLGFLGLRLRVQLARGARLSLWLLSRRLGEEVGEDLAAVAQAQRAVQLGFEGDVIDHLCPWCFAEAGRRRNMAAECPACHRRLRRPLLGALYALARVGAPVALLVGLGVWLFGPELRAVAPGPDGSTLLLEPARLRSYSAGGRLTATVTLPWALRARGGGTFLSPASPDGTLVGGPAGVWLWSGSGEPRPVLSPPDEAAEVVGAVVVRDGGVAAVASRGEEWVMYRTATRAGGRISASAMSILPVARPIAVLGELRGDLLLAMAGGGVARYKRDGQRAGWLVNAEDTGLLAGGGVWGAERLVFVDVEPLGFWSFRSERPDLIQTVEADGSISATVRLGQRPLPLPLRALAPSASPDGLRPEVACLLPDRSVLLLDPASGRLVTVSASGRFQEQGHAELSAYLLELRRWRAAATVCWLLAPLSVLLWGSIRLATRRDAEARTGAA